MSSQASTPSSPSSITEEISTRTMSDVVKDFNTEELIDYLGRKDLKLKETHFKILRKEEITGLAFLKLTKEDFRSIGFALGPATVLAEIIEVLGQKIRNYSSLKTLIAMLTLFFFVVFEEINDDDKAFEHCMEDIILKLSNVETMTDANEATRFLQKDISGEDATGRVDYAIKVWKTSSVLPKGSHAILRLSLAQLESAFQTNKKKRTADQAFGNDYFDYIYGIVTTSTEWHFIIYTPDGIYCTSGSEYQINLTKSSIKDSPELLRSNVKRIELV
uniref:SAM domain-containing protein n=1 Tax=Rhizophagus irregularis (strain DAOM 181602 / DAOM 197198 / MUCL 43194) TaxID=747089 RepID=U9SLN1_RHIID